MIDTEFLSADELAEVSGYKNPAGQREWLDRNNWEYVLNAAKRPVVGRWFARMKLAGIKPTAQGFRAEPATAWKPDFSALARH